MATANSTSTSATKYTRTFHEGFFKISDGIKPHEKLDQASLFLDTAHKGVDEMVTMGEANISLLWGFAHMIEAAKALVDSANAEMVKGGAA